MNIDKKAFSLIEIMVGILIVSLVIVSGFQAYSKISIGKIILVENTNIQKDSFYFIEKLFEIIKEGGTLDYEEYFNRTVLGTTFSSGHYDLKSGFGNYGHGGTLETTTYGGFYYCISNNAIQMPSAGCHTNFNTDRIVTAGANRFQNYSGQHQKYGQYSYQFIDYNSNFDSDLGDEDGNGVITGDDDDEFLGIGPSAFIAGSDVKELYLLSGDKKTRTLIRWNVKRDPDAPTTALCNNNGSGALIGANFAGCRGTIEFLKLEGVDWGYDYNSSAADGTQNDGVIDTWLVDKQFTGLTNIDNSTSIIAGATDTDTLWKDLFPTGINVVDFKVYPYPNLDNKYFWKDPSASTNISPYVILNFKIKPSWETRKKIKKDSNPLNFNITVNLTDIFSK
ncbi:prepilin-type N-terminal cleavage/methylation domain-containing protein [Candidatus Gracilibacteria bacterium]|nr:prepilin-type N-terminal cleavage/methylation domain-containing protein [Candidatus Gracilibacteria bacterium]